MTKRELVMAALAGREANRVPLAVTTVKSQRRWIIEAPMHSMVSESGRFRGW